MFLIWSHEHKAWWRPNSMGYTRELSNAGIYREDDAKEIVERATLNWNLPPNELPVRIEDLPDAAKALVGQL